MQQPANDRKSPAHGASPMGQQPMQQQQQQPAYQYPPMPDNTFNFDDYDIYPADQSYTNSGFDANALSALTSAQPSTYAGNAGNAAPSNFNAQTLAPAASTDLVRRSRHPFSPQPPPDQKSGYGSMNGQAEEESEVDLHARVNAAKKDAQGKRKQIPPFVQKLSSFLDSNNTELIRWSDDGRSFIVLDEDEFARTLIPELFKHNNYASFVRQLNMYGFHKTVNITDGSLRQSEKARKGVKPPSMYSHTYFRRNRPDLLWLIQKPITKTGSKRKRDGTGADSDDERQFSPGPDGRPDQGGGGDLTTYPRNELRAVRQDLKKLQLQQEFISQLITQLKEQNTQFYRQATAFQALHDRHENSINAILTFLATFYNRSVEGHSGQNLVNMFSNMAQNQSPPSGVVEEFNDNAENVTENGNQQIQRYVKRPQLLLPGPNSVSSPSGQFGTASTESNSARPSASPPPYDGNPPTNPGAASRSLNAPLDFDTSSSNTTTNHMYSNNTAPNFDTSSTKTTTNPIPESDQMLSLINSVNATNASTPNTAAPDFDFSAFAPAANGNVNVNFNPSNSTGGISQQQRDDMLAAISGTPAAGNANNALVTPTPPPMPDLDSLQRTQAQLEMLTSMQRLQDDKVQALQRRLQPLSPTGTIPGLRGDIDPFDAAMGAPCEFDPDAYIDFDNPDGEGLGFGDGGGGGGGEGGDYNWDFGNGDGAADATGGGGGADMFQMPAGDGEQLQAQGDGMGNADGNGRVESVTSAAASPNAAPAAAVEEESETPRKRVKRG